MYAKHVILQKVAEDGVKHADWVRSAAIGERASEGSARSAQLQRTDTPVVNYHDIHSILTRYSAAYLSLSSI
jgi:hypothetical protein